MSESLTRDDVLRVVSEARERGDRLDLRDTNLRDTNLRGADLRCANLWGADLRYASLSGADLRCANLRDADLRGADLRCANLWGASLSGADLRYADLRGANLWGADLYDADLRCADLRDADLRGALWGGIQITDLPSGQLILTPTCDGWHMRVGCWEGTLDQLRDLIAQDDGWPEAEGDEITRRRPYLQAALALCEVHMADHADVIDKLKEKWGK